MGTEIKSITFLTSAKVILAGEDPEEVSVQVDMVNRKVFWANNGYRWDEVMEDKFFAHILESTKLPDDLFSAPADAVDTARDSQAQHAEMRVKQVEED